MTSSTHAPNDEELLLSIQRALLGNVHPPLRQVSADIDAGAMTIRLRFEYDGGADDAAREAGEVAASEITADLHDDWTLVDEHLARPSPMPLSRLRLLAFLRADAIDSPAPKTGEVK